MTFHLYLQRFRERLSHKQGEAYVTMSKVIMGNGSMNGAQGVSACKRKPHKPVESNCEPQSSSTKLFLPIILFTKRHCRILFYTLVRQPLLKQLLI